jgi:dTDP-4-dehydrorhamnose reductase
MTGADEGPWADFAEAIFTTASQYGRPRVHVNRIATSDYPTPARRRGYSRLDKRKLRKKYGITLPNLRTSVEDCVRWILDQEAG